MWDFIPYCVPLLRYIIDKFIKKQSKMVLKAIFMLKPLWKRSYSQRQHCLLLCKVSISLQIEWKCTSCWWGRKWMLSCSDSAFIFFHGQYCLSICLYLSHVFSCWQMKNVEHLESMGYIFLALFNNYSYGLSLIE